MLQGSGNKTKFLVAAYYFLLALFFISVIAPPGQPLSFNTLQAFWIIEFLSIVAGLFLLMPFLESERRYFKNRIIKLLHFAIVIFLTTLLLVVVSFNAQNSLLFFYFWISMVVKIISFREADAKERGTRYKKIGWTAICFFAGFTIAIFLGGNNISMYFLTLLLYFVLLGLLEIFWEKLDPFRFQ